MADTIHNDIMPSMGMSDIANEILSTPESKAELSLHGKPPPPPKLKAKEEKKAAHKPTSSVSEASDEGVTADDIEALAKGAEESAHSDSDAADESDGEVEKPKAKVWKLKANGKEYTADSEEKLVAAAQRGIAIEQQFQKMRADIDRMRSDLTQKLQEAEAREKEALDPVSYLKKHAKDPESAIEQMLLDRAKEAIEMQNMSPRERQLYQERKTLQDQLKSREASEKDVQTRQEAALVEQQKQIIGDTFAKALTENKMPSNNATVRVMAAVYRAALNKGVELTPAQAAQLTKEQLDGISKAYSPDIEAMSGEDLLARYPKASEAIRKALIAKYKSGKPTTPEEAPIKARAKDGKYKKSKDLDHGEEWDKSIERMKKEGNALRVKSGWGVGY